MLTKILMITLGVTNLPQSVTFYKDLVGLELTGQSEGFAFFNAGGVTLALNVPLGKSIPPGKGSMELVFPVESVLEAHRQLRARGAQFRNEPREVNAGNWAATFSDPDGNLLTIYGPK